MHTAAACVKIIMSPERPVCTHAAEFKRECTGDTMKIVFFGDSITDCDRDRSDETSLGNGYVKILADKLRPIYPDMDIELINKGISGNEVCDLLARAKRDVVDYKPDAVVIMIGINNVIHKFKYGKELNLVQFERDLKALIKLLKDEGIVVIFLEPFLPAPRVRKTEEGFRLYDPERTMGRVRSFYGNFLVVVRALTYILTLGREGIPEASAMAVLNANYLMKKLAGRYDMAYDTLCMHEFVMTLEKESRLYILLRYRNRLRAMRRAFASVSSKRA